MDERAESLSDLAVSTQPPLTGSRGGQWRRDVDTSPSGESVEDGNTQAVTQDGAAQGPLCKAPNEVQDFTADLMSALGEALTPAQNPEKGAELREQREGRSALLPEHDVNAARPIIEDDRADEDGASDTGLARQTVSAPMLQIALDQAIRVPETCPAEDGYSRQSFVEIEAERVEDQSPSLEHAAGPIETAYELEGLLHFEAEADPQEVYYDHARQAATGTFIPIVPSSPSILEEEATDWHLDLVSVPVLGDGLGGGARNSAGQGSENDFLKVRSRGRQSNKQAVVPVSTRIAIDQDFCRTWAEEIFSKGWCSPDDLDRIVARCEGNGDAEELCVNLQRNLEAVGFDVFNGSQYDACFWDLKSDTSLDDLVDAVDAVLSRSTRLPGTQRFVLSRSAEQQLLDSLIRAKQGIQMGLLGSDIAVENIIQAGDRIRDGNRDPRTVSLKNILPSRSDHTETSEFWIAIEKLRSWYANGGIMNGRRRREAIGALEALDLTWDFQKDLIRKLEGDPASLIKTSELEAEVLICESATERLVLEHLPYVRRFASRHVREGEEPEDVFQVAFMGLHRAIGRFDPERGYRFMTYATYWMRQTIERWRADEGSAIRIPVHRLEHISKFDSALSKLDTRADVAPSNVELAEDLEWPLELVRQLRRIPREAEYPNSNDDWDSILQTRDEEDVVELGETRRIVADMLAELPERQADVIRMRFGVGRETEMTLEEVGKVYGVTRERIRQIEAKTLRHLRHPGRMRRLSELLGR